MNGTRALFNLASHDASAFSVYAMYVCMLFTLPCAVDFAQMGQNMMQKCTFVSLL